MLCVLGKRTNESHEGIGKIAVSQGDEYLECSELLASSFDCKSVVSLRASIHPKLSWLIGDELIQSELELERMKSELLCELRLSFLTRMPFTMYFSPPARPPTLTGGIVF